jgi:hypothetical protein
MALDRTAYLGSVGDKAGENATAKPVPSPAEREISVFPTAVAFKAIGSIGLLVGLLLVGGPCFLNWWKAF